MSDNIAVHLPRKLPAGITKERAEELTRWVYKVWELHWKQFAPTSNSRAQFQQYVLRDYKILDSDNMKNIENSVRAYTKHLKKLKNSGQKLIGVKTLSVWYNQECYNDQFIDDMDRHAPHVELSQCSVAGCFAKVHGPSFKYCVDHIPNTNIEVLRDGYRCMVNAEDIDKNDLLTPQMKAIFAKHRSRVIKSMEQFK